MYQWNQNISILIVSQRSCNIERRCSNGVLMYPNSSSTPIEIHYPYARFVRVIKYELCGVNCLFKNVWTMEHLHECDAGSASRSSDKITLNYT